MNHVEFQFLMNGTLADARLLKKALKAYLPKATALEKTNIELYTEMIDRCVERGRAYAESQKERE